MSWDSSKQPPNCLTAPVLSREEVMPGVYLLWLEALSLASSQPGQFLMVGCGEGVLLPRPFSVHRVQGERVALLVKEQGWGTGWLCRRSPGERVRLLGPLGQGFALPQRAQQLLLIAGGMGIAPILFLAERAIAAGKEVTLLLGASSAPLLYPSRPLPGGARALLATEDGSVGKRGMVTGLLQGLKAEYDAVFACGPKEMYLSLRQAPQLQGKPVQVSLEVRMGCGFGACLGCAIPTRGGMKLVCRDGPVFELEEVDWAGVTL